MSQPHHDHGSPLFQLQEVGFRYPNGAAALDGITLEIGAGEQVALLGANGCGKSTLLRLLDGLIFPTAGALRAFGADLSEESLRDDGFARGFRSRVGFIFQRSEAQLFSPTVWDEIAFGPMQLGASAAEAARRVDDVMRMLGIEALQERAPYHLSGGEQKKVAIASVLSMNPDILLLDEPTAALDPRTQRWLLDLLQKLQAAGKTTVIATHELDLLPLIATRAVVLNQDHQVSRDAPVAEVLADHRLLHAANLAHHHLPIPAPPGTAVLEPTQIHGAHDHEP